MSSTTVRIMPGGIVRLPEKMLKSSNLSEGDPMQVAIFSRDTICLSRPNNGLEQPAFVGRIESLGVADLFSLLQMMQKTGVLRVSTDEFSKSVYFQRGDVTFARSTVVDDRIGNVLYRTGRITREEWELAESAIAPDKRFGSILIEKGLLSTKSLWEGVRYQVEEIVYSLFALREGDFSFFDGHDLEEDLVGFHLSTQNILMEGFQRIDEYQLIQEKIPSRSTVFQLNDPLPDLEIGEREQELLQLADGMTDVETIIRNSRMGEFNCMRALFRLVKMGFLIPFEVGEVHPHEDELEEIETLEVSDDDKLYKIIERYNGIFAHIVKRAETSGAEGFLASANTFFEEVPERFSVLFQGLQFDPDGRLEALTLRTNAERQGAGGDGGSGSGLMKIAGLKDLFAETKLLDGLNELLNFMLFTVKNTVQGKAGDEITHEVREKQREAL